MYLKILLTLSLLITAGINHPALAQDSAALDAALAAQDSQHKARHTTRHPKETLEFLGIAPGMKVAEVLPGGGWYTKILLPYLGSEGHLIGIDYSVKMYSEWGEDSFANAEFLKKKETWVATWTATAEGWRNESSASVTATTLANVPDELDGSLDAVLLIRALHNMARFNSRDAYLDRALAASFKALKPGGTLGLVQHLARDDRSDEWADGTNGYLKRAFIVDQLTNAGFQFVSESAVNNNELDQAKEGDIVWRLPPSLSGTNDDDELIKAMQVIGESHRTTMKFIKPAQ